MVERSSAKLPMSIGDFDTFLSGGASPAQIAADREIVAAILRILPQRPREALLLQAAGLTGGEVAKAMGLSLCAVKKYRALTMDRAWRLVPAARGR
jgi:DNA-directed RNA polymerase specialized sigma24 family protein